MKITMWRVRYSTRNGVWQTLLESHFHPTLQRAPALWRTFEEATQFADLLKKGTIGIDKVWVETAVVLPTGEVTKGA